MSDVCRVNQTTGDENKGSLDSEQASNPGITGTATRPQDGAGRNSCMNPGIAGTWTRRVFCFATTVGGDFSTSLVSSLV